MICRRRRDGFVAWLLALVLVGCGLFCVTVAQDRKVDRPAGKAAGNSTTNPVENVLENADAQANPRTKADAEPPRRLYQGKVVLAQEALKQRGIKVGDEMKNQAVLETLNGDLIPIAADWRGRAFFQDKRLRNRRVDLVGFQRPGIPWLQTLIIYVINDKGEREVMDYWCDICSIPMYEIKDCECCQGPIRLRLQPGRLPDYLEKTDTTPASEK
ncbi:hypothetical protein GC176_04425 [bacterium]|nr:hypothetical protein [bacterium]